MKDYSLIENHFGIQIPAQIKMIHDYQDINNVKIFHRNFVGRYMYKFEFLSLNDLDESLCILPDDTDYADGENVFHIPILVKQKQNEYVEFDKHIFLLGEDAQTDIMMKLEIK